ncbi:MAG: hypothetical protein JW929_00035 [Anaerolineales bacterium]|nr:hypothetical protein [Anaerolineales bacterium]
MIGEGRERIDFRRHGLLSAPRRKQWWSFEGLDEIRRLYFVVLALESFPSSCVSLLTVNYESGERWEEQHLGSLRAAAGASVDVEARGGWGRVAFRGRAEDGWEIDVRTPRLRIECRQQARTPPHANRLLARSVDYRILQFPLNAAEGRIALEGCEFPFQGYGYFEHPWGVQPRHSAANWLHFWTPDSAGVVMDCLYDTGIPHHYTCLWLADGWQYLASPAQFSFTPGEIVRPWQIRSPDLELTVRPLHVHHSVMRLPPLVPSIDIDYYELLCAVEGAAWRRGETIEIRGIGKFDHNFNLW